MGTAADRPLAVVTGASSGIGLELTKQCVEHGFDVLIAASVKSRLVGLANEVLPETVKARIQAVMNKPGAGEPGEKA